jgi:hypothetical protein
LTGCAPAATTTGFTQPTSVRVSAEQIVPAAQCGRRSNQIAKYSAIASTGGMVVAGKTYDCFADAVFANIDAQQIDIEVFGWSQATFDANPVIASADATKLRGLPWAVHKQCSATQRDNVQVVASCRDAMDASMRDASLGDASMDAAGDASVGTQDDGG